MRATFLLVALTFAATGAAAMVNEDGSDPCGPHEGGEPTVVEDGNATSGGEGNASSAEAKPEPAPGNETPPPEAETPPPEGEPTPKENSTEGSIPPPEGEPTYCIMEMSPGDSSGGRPAPEDFNGVPPGTPCEGVRIDFNGATSVILRWPSVPGAEGYQVIKQQQGDESMLIFPRVPPSTNTTTLDGLAQGWWMFTVVAIVESEANESFCGIEYVPGPCHIGAEARFQGDGTILVTWPAVGNATGYQVIVETNGGDPTGPPLVMPPETSYVHTAMIGETYSFTVYVSREAEGWLWFCEVEPDEDGPGCVNGLSWSVDMEGRVEVLWRWLASSQETVVTVEHAGAEVHNQTFGDNVTGFLFEQTEAGETYTFKVATTTEAGTTVYCPVMVFVPPPSDIPFFPGATSIALATLGLVGAALVLRRK